MKRTLRKDPKAPLLLTRTGLYGPDQGLAVEPGLYLVLEMTSRGVRLCRALLETGDHARIEGRSFRLDWFGFGECGFFPFPLTPRPGEGNMVSRP